MKVKVLGYHHHSTFTIDENGRYKIIKLHGVFLEELSMHYDQLILFLYQNSDKNSGYEDYVIKRENIKIVSLGIKKNLIYRTIFGHKYANLIQRVNIDKIIVRSPTPLMPFIVNVLNNKTIPMVVGDYLEDIQSVTGSVLKRLIVKIWIHIFQNYYLKSFSKLQLVLFNNDYLRLKFKNYCNSTELISTSLVSKDYIINAKDYKKTEKKYLKIIYVGRVDLSKGLIELVDAAKLIEDNKLDFFIEIIGWDDSNGERTTKLIKEKIKTLQLEKKIIMTGKISHGNELMEKYRDADIFYIGSKYSEGFPRVIWEALSTGCSVICSKVGGVPLYVSENEVYFLNEVSGEEIFRIIMKIKSDPQLVQKKILKGIEIMKNFTLENSIKKIVNCIEKSS